jgi:hypothetical protein
MAKQATCTIYQHTKGKTLYLSIPSKMAQDSTFPFEAGEKVNISIAEGFLLIEKVRKK